MGKTNAAGRLGDISLYELVVATSAQQMCQTPIGDIDTQLAAIAESWDAARYGAGNEAAQRDALHLLEVQTTVLIRSCPRDTRARAWLGLIFAAEADDAEWYDALQLAGKARDLLLDAERERLDDETRLLLECALGALYTQAPPFPISFGDAGQARIHLSRALAIAPDGLEPNFYYADFLYRQHRLREAARAFAAVINAPASAARPAGDQNMRAEARERLAEIAQLTAGAQGGGE